MTSKQGFSPAVRKKTVHLAGIGLVILAAFAANDLYGGKIRRLIGSNKLAVPERLSCGPQNAAPTAWENGKIHFDFDAKVMAVNLRIKKVCVADRAWQESQDRLIHINGCQIVSTGQLIQERENGGYRVHAVEKLVNGALRVEWGSNVRSEKEPPIVLDCLTNPT